ncbi:uncharacterized protein VP01_14573g1, partial [Puccinia sorghi]
ISAVKPKTKYQVANTLMLTLARWETQTGMKVKILHLENGEEFDSTKFGYWLQGVEISSLLHRKAHSCAAA